MKLSTVCVCARVRSRANGDEIERESQFKKIQRNNSFHWRCDYAIGWRAKCGLFSLDAIASAHMQHKFRVYGEKKNVKINHCEWEVTRLYSGCDTTSSGQAKRNRNGIMRIKFGREHCTSVRVLYASVAFVWSLQMINWAQRNWSTLVNSFRLRISIELALFSTRNKRQINPLKFSNALLSDSNFSGFLLAWRDRWLTRRCVAVAVGDCEWEQRCSFTYQSENVTIARCASITMTTR